LKKRYIRICYSSNENEVNEIIEYEENNGARLLDIKCFSSIGIILIFEKDIQ